MKGKTTKPTKQLKKTAALNGATATPSTDLTLPDKTIKPEVRELTEVNLLGVIVLERCSHTKVPGLDADYCKECRVYYVDQQMRSALLSGSILPLRPWEGANNPRLR